MGSIKTFMEGIKKPISIIWNVINARTEGLSLNSTCRVFGIAKNTLLSRQHTHNTLKPQTIFQMREHMPTTLKPIIAQCAGNIPHTEGKQTHMPNLKLVFNAF